MAALTFSWWRVSLIVGLSACGLDLVGTVADVPSNGGSSALDASTAIPDAAVFSDASWPDGGPNGCDEGACAAFGAMWQPVAFSLGTTAECPSDSASASIVRTDPIAGAGACTCAITSTPPSCANGAVTFKTGNGCNSSAVVTTLDEPCHQVSGTLDPHITFVPLTPSGGGCSVTATEDGSKVTTAAATLCEPPVSCRGALCNKTAPPGFEACIVASGDVTCDQPGFSEKHLIGTGGSVTCSGDCGTCEAQNPTCTAVSIDLYSDTACGAKVFTVVPNSCTATGTVAGTTIGSMAYHATFQATYVATGSLTAAASLANVRTVCCAP